MIVEETISTKELTAIERLREAIKEHQDNDWFSQSVTTSFWNSAQNTGRQIRFIHDDEYGWGSLIQTTIKK